MKSEKSILWLIDEDEYQLRIHARIFARILPDSIEVKPVEAYPHLADYLQILEDPRTVCIITDQKLKERGTADYLGIELAEYLRGINQKIPIYILTNYADDKDDFVGGEWSVEDIIRKSEILQENEQKILASRILRRISLYEDILGEREENFHSLLKKSMLGELTPSEVEELEEIQLQKASPTLAKELAQIKQMEEIVKAHRKLMSQFNQTSEKGGNDDL